MSNSFQDKLVAIVADPLDIVLMRGIENLLDPHGLMNPGKTFAAGGVQR
ncbi:FAD-linked oxidase C-terminal domain-containing protein [Bradyrhizobium sp. BR 10289]|nr:FAD-linked oxidase C-terminal domain-containing protein [Bradyrhizobium sp. BR 10289]MBW7967958.1 hypothetical protein [Bradyrhizobium sp. BR 10289]